MNRTLKIILICLVLFLASCSISPGVNPTLKSSFSGKYFETTSGEITKPTEITHAYIAKNKKTRSTNDYLISPGDVLTITIWGLNEIFPLSLNIQTASPLSSRTVNSDGTIFFPYVGVISVQGKTIPEVRNILINGLSDDFIEPQVDVTITKFNKNRNIFIFGEVNNPVVLSKGIEDISLMNALGESKGLNVTTSRSNEIFIIRNIEKNPEIFYINLGTPDRFILADQFYLKPKDVVFVGPADITRWNRVISQFFPFASILNQVDQLSRD